MLNRVGLGDEERAEVCLVVPPFDTVRFPALGVSVLAAACRTRGIGIKLVYGSISLASRIDYVDYVNVCDCPSRALAGERLFLPHAYPAETLGKIGRAPALRDDLQALVEKLAGEIGPFLQDLVEKILALRPKIVGISSNFQQNLATMSIARIVKRMAPEIRIVLGGANIDMPMAAGLARVFPWIDHFISGEADIEFPAFCERVLRGDGQSEPQLIACPPIEDMSQVGEPDFSDYFQALREAQRNGRIPTALPNFLTMESSRGCWWGEKHHCTFCGLNSAAMGFRQKPAAQVLEEIHNLTARWGVNGINAADTIMPLSYLRDVLPKLAQKDPLPSLFYEVKSNLRDDQLDVMANGGLRSIQAGIESLSSNVLRLMRKGVSAQQNIALLRSCRSRGMRVLWNYIYGFPDERVEDYEAALRLVPKIEHLQPPINHAPILIDRFSPYHNNPEHFGISEISPFEGYYGLYPNGAPVSDIAYHFEGHYTTPFLDNAKLVEAFQAALTHWRERWTKAQSLPLLCVVGIGATKILVITDTRSIARKNLVPISLDVDAALKYLERPRSRADLPPEIDAHVDFLVDNHFVIEHESLLLSVVTRPATVASDNASLSGTLAPSQIASFARNERQPISEITEVGSV